jgi:hypothetical protein
MGMSSYGQYLRATAAEFLDGAGEPA